MSENKQRIAELFERALDFEPTERAAFLAGACGNDINLRRRVEDLLAAHGQKSGFLPDEGGTTVSAPTVLDKVALTEGAGAVIGRYKLLEKLGEGGFGSVWAAEQREPVKRRVALKIIKLGMDTKQVVARFEAERQALALMDHPNIAKVLDAGTTDTGRPFFVMELVKGIPITKYCDHEKLGTKDRLELFIKVCQAIQHAHQKGIIHRDIKPSNIMVTLHDGVPVPKVIDFGIAKATQQELTELTIYTQHHQFIGTPAYMSPEQAEMSGLDIDTRSDIYSLGVLLYELLTGKTPFDAKELMQSGIDEMRRIIREQEPVRPSTRLSQALAANEVGRVAPRAPGLTDEAPTRGAHGVTRPTTDESRASSRRLLQELKGDLDWIVMKCLEKDRTRRYETANGLAADLKRHLGNEPVTARPPTAAYRLQKTWRRNKLVFGAATAVAVAMLVGVGVSAWQAIRATRAEHEQSKMREVAVNALDGEKAQRAQAQMKQEEAEVERQRADTQALKASESEQQSRRLLYASDMNLAQQSLKLNNLGRARRLVERHRPQPGEEDLRGWEWRYLWQLTRSSALVTLTNRPVRGYSVSFSPDGTRLAVGWGDGHVELWDVPNRQMVRALTTNDYHHLSKVAFSPVHNVLAVTAGTNGVALYDLDSGRESILWRGPDQSAWQVRDLAFSQDGSRVVIYGGLTERAGDAVWVVNVSSSQIESHHPTGCEGTGLHGAAQLSPDNRRLYLPRSENRSASYTIQCLDLATGDELWRTEPQLDKLTTLAISPDGRVLASGTGFADPAVRVWDAASGRLIRQLDGHTAWVSKLVFSGDGRRLASASTDQTIRFWDTSAWTETRVLRGHTDEVNSVAISDSAGLVASAGKDGDIMLWKEDGKSAVDRYDRLLKGLGSDQVVPMDHSRLLLLPTGRPPEWADLKGDAFPVSLPDIGSPRHVLGWFGTNILCRWDGTNQILVDEFRGAGFIQRGVIALDSATRPLGFTYNPTRQLLAWSDGASSNAVYLASLAAPDLRTELRSDVPRLTSLRFSKDGSHLAAANSDSLRVWNLETGQVVRSIREPILLVAFAAGGRVLVVSLNRSTGHEIQFYDLGHSDSAPRSIHGSDMAWQLAVSPDEGLVAAATVGGLVRLFDPVRGELIEDLRGHLNAVHGVVFSPDGRRLISSSTPREAVKIWDVVTRQELLTLAGAGSGRVHWSADGDVILAGRPWQAWRAPSWEEIAAAEAKEKAEGKQP